MSDPQLPQRELAGALLWAADMAAHATHDCEYAAELIRGQDPHYLSLIDSFSRHARALEELAARCERLADYEMEPSA